jgi:GT2 family glycosyltransferase
MVDALIITVSYKGADSTAQFLESGSRLCGFDSAHFIVVENASNDGSTEKLRPLVSAFRNVELFESQTNRGYFGGANWALQKYLSTKPLPDWVVICNNDILFDDPNFLSKLIARNHRDVGVLAPAIIPRLTGVDCNPVLRKRPSRLQIFRYRLWLSHFYMAWTVQFLAPYVRILRDRLGVSRRRERSGGPTAIYAAHGSFFVFSRAYFEAGGFIDDGFFLYAEEFTVAEICRQLGLSIVHDPDLRVWHDGHRTTGRLCSRPMYKETQRGLQYVLDKYFRPKSANGQGREAAS